LDRLCRTFERRFRGPSPLSIEDCLSQVAPSRRDKLLFELLATELEIRIEAGESPSPENYVRRFPHAVAAIEQVFSEVRRFVARNPQVESETPADVPRPTPSARWAEDSAITASSASSDAAAWGLSTRRSKNP
jgi:hypothetical protein